MRKLMVDEETIPKRDSMRPEECQMKDRCLVLLNDLKNQNFEEAHILDTSNLSIQETAEIILKDDRFSI